MKKVILIYGGVRSGKSSYAASIAEKMGKQVTVIATSVLPDEEMLERIAKHKRSRPAHWEVIEEGTEIAAVLNSIGDTERIVILDCLGVWISNYLLKELTDDFIENEIEYLIQTLNKINYSLIIVSNEAGSGVVPPYPLGRRFRDLLGLANQQIAKVADEVILMQVGIPVKIK
jgi:adenosylcobinamide kinase/adenosylcobinamide-phosphate guanylyltransferase